jgi:1,4-dihydroxy-2-naphthoate octaprenyltransferase
MAKHMWVEALSGIPRITKAEWNELDIISKWLIATRAAVLIITFLSAGISGILAYRDGLFDLKVSDVEVFPSINTRSLL